MTADESTRVLPFETESDDLDFEVETETLPDGRLIHYYRWPERLPAPPADEGPTPDV